MARERDLRLALRGVVAAAGTLPAGTAFGDASRLLVFLHLAVKQRALETMLQGVLPGIIVTAVGRTADFERALEETQDGVLTLPVVLASKGLSPRMRGYRGGAPDEVYSLIGADSSPDPAKVASVGALDLLGREGTTAFVQELLGSKPKVERVTKVEDLLPLLQMQRVEAVLLPARLFPEIQRLSRLTLAARDLPLRVGLPALAATGAGGGQVASAISKLPAQTLRTMGVDEWH
jgi:hypothetical protein